MSQGEVTRFHMLSRPVMRAAFSAALAMAILVGATAQATAQDTLTPAQRQTLAQCLIGCKKGDANCQNACTNKVATPAYFSAAGFCVRACADALVVSGQQDQNLADDLQKCVEACN